MYNSELSTELVKRLSSEFMDLCSSVRNRLHTGEGVDEEALAHEIGFLKRKLRVFKCDHSLSRLSSELAYCKRCLSPVPLSHIPPELYHRVEGL